MSDSREETALAAIPVGAQDSGLLTTKEMAAAMGISPSTLKRKVQNGELPAVREGTKLLFRRTESVEIASSGPRAVARDREQARGVLAADAFKLFAANTPIEDVVVQLQAPPDVVLALLDQYVACRRRTEEATAHRCACGAAPDPSTARCLPCFKKLMAVSDEERNHLAGRRLGL